MTARFARAWRWIKAGLIALAGLAAALLGIRLVQELRARLGPVNGPGASWMPDPGDDSRILVTIPDAPAPVPVPLPEGIRPQEIRAVAIDERVGEIVVEVLHHAKDRRGMLRGNP